MNAEPVPERAVFAASRALIASAARVLIAATVVVAGFLPDPMLRAAEEGPSQIGTAVAPGALIEPSSRESAEIQWRNGEILRGELSGAEEDRLLWTTPLFEEPVRLRQEVIRRVDFPGGFVAAGGDFRVVLTDGSHLTGTLEGIDEQTVTLAATQGGTVALRRDHVAALERIRGPGMLAAGPAALLTAESASKGRFERSGAYLAAAGQSAIVAFNGGVRHTLELPEKTSIELRLQAPEEPRFVLRAQAGESWVAIETWEDEIVLTAGDRFASAGAGSARAGEPVSLRLIWDRSAGDCALYGEDGRIRAEITGLQDKDAADEDELERAGSERLPTGKEESETLAAMAWLAKQVAAVWRIAATWVASEETVALPLAMAKVLGEQLAAEERRSAVVEEPAEVFGQGLTLINRGSGFFVDRYAVSEWRGQQPGSVLHESSYVTTFDEAMPAEVLRCDGVTVVVSSSGGETLELMLEQVTGIYSQRPLRLERDPASTELWFRDGSLLRGRLEAMEGGQVRMATVFSAEPVLLGLVDPRALVLAKTGDKVEEPPALEGLDTLTAGELSIHGVIRPTGKQRPEFQPVGSDAPLMPAASAALRMSRSLPKGSAFERAPALLHVKGQETWPVSLVGISPEKVEFAWEGAESREIGTDAVHAIQLRAPEVGSGGFDGSGWRVLGRGGRVLSRSGEWVILPPDTGIGHAYLMQSGDFSFRMTPEAGMSSLRVRLFCQGVARDSDSLNFLVAYYGNQIYSGKESGETGQMEMQSTTASGNSPALIRFALRGDTVDMFINDVQGVSAQLGERRGRKSGAGVVIETAAVWGNRIGPALLKDFTVHNAPSLPGPPPFSEDAKREALLLPRLRRDLPPRQVLVAQNGDLLRGEIASMAAGNLLFRTGLEHFKVPLDRLSAVVWVAEPDKTFEENVPRKHPVQDEAESQPSTEDAEADDASSQWLDLTNGGRLGLAVEEWTPEHVAGRHPLLGSCRIPTELVHSVSTEAPKPGGAWAALANWKFENTIDPLPPGSEEANASPLLGQAAADFTLPMMEGPDFVLSQAKGKVVVLDFWATWCAPCARALPPLIETLSSFPQDEVVLLAVNQGESKEQAQRFLDARGLQVAVAFDSDMKVARQFEVEGIPHTMVIDAEGKIVYVSTGAIPDGEKKVADAVRKALGIASPAAVEGGPAAEESGAAPGEEPGSESREES